MCILEQTTSNITVRISNKRWNRLMDLENAYRIAKSVHRAKKESENAQAMTIDEAKRYISSL